MTSNKKMGSGLALGALAAAAAAGYYFYASKDAKKNRRIARAWAKEMKTDVLKRAEKIKNVDKSKLAAVVDNVATAYRSAKNVDGKELAKAAKELKNNWRHIAAELSNGGPTRKSASKKAKKTSKKATRKA